MFAEVQFIGNKTPDFQSVSFVIPAHNEQQFIGDTIIAIQKAVNELALTAEIIVVNDDSTDDTVAIARNLGARTLNVAIRNIGAVRNAGAGIAKYDWLFFVDADTIVPTETFRQSLLYLAAGDVGGGSRVVIDESQPIFWVKRLMYLSVVLVWQIIGGWAAGCFMFCKKDVFDTFDGFDEAYFAGEELFFSLQLKRLGRFRLVRHPVVTSARKLHRYSSWQLARFVVVPLLNLRSTLKSKCGLEILYEDNR